MPLTPEQREILGRCELAGRIVPYGVDSRRTCVELCASGLLKIEARETQISYVATAEGLAALHLKPFSNEEPE